MPDHDVQLSQVGATVAPDDLRLWLGEERLLRAVIEQAAHVASTSLPGGDFHHRAGSFPVAQLLAFTAYCYLTGQFNSLEIEERLESDEALRYLCAGRFPSSTVLRHFRRSRRDLLLAMLTLVLSVAVCERVRQPWFVAAAAFGSHGRTLPGGGDGIWEACRLDAESRLSRSVRADAMALDV